MVAIGFVVETYEIAHILENVRLFSVQHMIHIETNFPYVKNDKLTLMFSHIRNDCETLVKQSQMRTLACL